MLSRPGKKCLLIAIFVAVAAGLWWQRAPLVRSYYLHRLSQANESQQAECAERVAGFDMSAVPGLIGLLRRDDARICGNANAAMAALEKHWGPTDTRTAILAKDLANNFGSLSTPGRAAATAWLAALLRELDAGQATSPTAVDYCRNVALEALASKDQEVCAMGIRLAMQAPLAGEKSLLGKVVPLLQASSPDVRRAAVLAVGLEEDAVTVEELLPLLQDSDTEVRRLCEAALRGRGLPETHIKLAKLITDERPAQRLQVVHYLSETEDLDSGIWLMRLSQDPSPAVRAAAVRFAADDPGASSFRQRMLLMAREDPSPTVRQLAAFYVNKAR